MKMDQPEMDRPEMDQPEMDRPEMDRRGLSNLVYRYPDMNLTWNTTILTCPAKLIPNIQVR